MRAFKAVYYCIDSSCRNLYMDDATTLGSFCPRVHITKELQNS